MFNKLISRSKIVMSHNINSMSAVTAATGSACEAVADYVMNSNLVPTDVDADALKAAILNHYDGSDLVRIDHSLFHKEEIETLVDGNDVLAILKLAKGGVPMEESGTGSEEKPTKDIEGFAPVESSTESGEEPKKAVKKTNPLPTFRRILKKSKTLKVDELTQNHPEMACFSVTLTEGEVRHFNSQFDGKVLVFNQQGNKIAFLQDKKVILGSPVSDKNPGESVELTTLDSAEVLIESVGGL